MNETDTQQEARTVRDGYHAGTDSPSLNVHPVRREPVIPPVAEQFHPHWCQGTDTCYSSSDTCDPRDTACHSHIWSTDNGIDMFEVVQVRREPVPGVTFDILPAFASLGVEDLPAAAQVLLQVYRDLTGTHPSEFERPQLTA